MSAWRIERYYCANIAGGCRYALRDIPVSATEFRLCDGLCLGTRDDGCRMPLVRGRPLDQRLKWFTIALCAVAAGWAATWVVRALFFPPPIQHVAFASAETQTDAEAGALQLELTRDANLTRRVSIEYVSSDGTAKAGADYETVHSHITFEPGERRKSIRITVLPDRTFQKEAREFRIVLTNVVGTPEHVIRIAPRAADRTQQMQADQAILSTSRIAADIATFMLKRRLLHDLLAARAGTPAEAKQQEQQLLEVEDNLSRAREGYSQSLRDLQTFPAPLVIRTIDRLHDDLQQRQFGQQSRALVIMKAHFAELVDKKPMDLDRWTRELETAIPHLRPGDPGAST